jgi:transposase
VSSGRTDRHRLHRGGDRDASTALWRIALVRLHCHQPTKDYVARRTAEGKTKEILRCLKRYIAREASPLLVSGLAWPGPGSQGLNP